MSSRSPERASTTNEKVERTRATYLRCSGPKSTDGSSTGAWLERVSVRLNRSPSSNTPVYTLGRVGWRSPALMRHQPSARSTRSCASGGYIYTGSSSTSMSMQCSHRNALPSIVHPQTVALDSRTHPRPPCRRLRPRTLAALVRNGRVVGLGALDGVGRRGRALVLSMALAAAAAPSAAPAAVALAVDKEGALEVVRVEARAVARVVAKEVAMAVAETEVVARAAETVGVVKGAAD
jgi:hypothetical protein